MMLLIRPWVALSCLASEGLVTTIRLSFISTLKFRATLKLSLPFGPSTATSPFTETTFTPCGTFMGLLPIRDIIPSPRLSPCVAYDLSAYFFLARLLVGHGALESGDDRYAEPAVNL